MFKKFRNIMFKCQKNIETIFPNEIMLKIFGNLDLKDLGRCTMVSKTFSEISRHSILVLLQNVTGLKDISQAMDVLHDHPILMKCVWKFYDIDKECLKDKHVFIDKLGFVDKHCFASIEPIDVPIKILKDIEKLPNENENVELQLEKVSCFLKKYTGHILVLLEENHQSISYKNILFNYVHCENSFVKSLLRVYFSWTGLNHVEPF